MKRLMVVCVSAALLLAGCGGSGDEKSAGSGDLASIDVSSGATPTIKVGKDFSASKTESDVLKEGGGDEIKEGDTVKVNYLAVNGRTGKQFDSSYAAGSPATFTLSQNSMLPGFIKSLVDQKIGSRVLVAIAPEDGFGQARAELDLKADDTMVFLFDLVAKVPTEASGKDKKLPADVPKLKLEDGKPAGFTATDSTPKVPSEASAHVVIEGDGPEVKKDQNLSVQYVGQVYPSGKVFDSSWERGAPTPFTLSEGQLITCWTDLLPGVKVGSRVILVCPADTAYGEAGKPPSIGKNEPLIFAIDVLDAS